MKNKGNGRYEVQFKAFKTGNWYTKTITDSFAGASSVFTVGNYGRAKRLIDRVKNIVLDEHAAEADGYTR